MLAGSWQYWSPIGKSLETPEAESDNIKMISRDNDIYKYESIVVNALQKISNISQIECYF